MDGFGGQMKNPVTFISSGDVYLMMPIFIVQLSKNFYVILIIN